MEASVALKEALSVSRVNDVINAPSVSRRNKLERDYLLCFGIVKQFEVCFEAIGLRRLICKPCFNCLIRC